ncbi:hypothetical protein SCORR_v1c09440 [Spiroplasma corruscae]|uniref:Uncharacterized protein n=1 Tax=Spiroplasma corruscae TaxID=216934 RepID=A0A222EQM6_9MOLU|nr:hypothetical protein [Spiroplasma corruscae]ASP28716.1 hypothetical protein SCORR_v1c09440 [Spiroplasma corruscae]
MDKIELDKIAENAWSNALECQCGATEDKFDIHRICIVCNETINYNKHYSCDSSNEAWNIKFYNNEFFNKNKFSGITLAVHCKCSI